jgi:hypothetical protein
LKKQRDRFSFYEQKAMAMAFTKEYESATKRQTTISLKLLQYDGAAEEETTRMRVQVFIPIMDSLIIDSFVEAET